MKGQGTLKKKADKALSRLSIEVRRKPSEVELPPYFTDTPEMRRLWARYHDIISVFDQDVKAVFNDLEKDGVLENTIVFIMSDHGMGMPRYKRWLYLTGLHVPLIVHIPKKFKDLSPYGTTAKSINEITSYVNLPATALNLAGISVPEVYEGKPILGRNAVTKGKYIFGAKDRADDMYDLSRCVFDGRYLYIRHYLPHQIPMQEGYIMSDYRKDFHKELYKIRKKGKDTEQSEKLWQRRPFEELYDVQNDPQELKNIANDSSYGVVKERLKYRLKKWILETRDSGFLTESDMHRRANENGITPYEVVQSPELYPLEKILRAADLASDPKTNQADLLKLYDDNDPIVSIGPSKAK